MGNFSISPKWFKKHLSLLGYQLFVHPNILNKWEFKEFSLNYHVLKTLFKHCQGCTLWVILPLKRWTNYYWFILCDKCNATDKHTWLVFFFLPAGLRRSFRLSRKSSRTKNASWFWRWSTEVQGVICPHTYREVIPYLREAKDKQRLVILVGEFAYSSQYPFTQWCIYPNKLHSGIEDNWKSPSASLGTAEIWQYSTF